MNYRFYKYIGHGHWFENLQECKFNVTKPSEFNDPFDCTGVIREPWNDDAKAQFHDRETFLGKMNDRSWADEFYRVLCLTDAQLCDAASEVLFWSHYANLGKGIRVTLEVGNGTFIPPGNVQCVRYCHAKPVLDMEHYKKGSLDLYNYLSDCMTTKGIGWDYEHEVRVIFEKEKTFSDAVVAAKDIRFVRIQDSCVKEITFGPMFHDEEARNFAYKLIPVFGDSSIFYKAVRDDVYYRYNYYPLFDNEGQ